MNQAAKLLEFDKIIEELCGFALSENAKRRLASLEPYSREADCLRGQEETTSARKILDTYGTAPVASMKEIEKIRTLCKAGAMLMPEQLEEVGAFLSSCKRMKSYLNKAELIDSRVAVIGRTLDEMSDLREEIDRCIRSSRVDSNASATLKGIRKRMEAIEVEIKEKLDAILRSKKGWFSDGFYALRDGHYVLPVKKEYKRQFEGAAIANSSTGGTCFMEPASVIKLQNELGTLRIDEDSEVRRILYTLTAMVEERDPALHQNAEAMETLDYLFAKAKLSVRMGASPANIGMERRIDIKKGRHPLLPRENCVPLDFTLGGGIRGAAVTGPNTGGKTVALKTVGLLSMMAQSGLHVPADPDSVFTMHSGYFGDIGDGQSISENLSTFSSHIRNIVSILEQADQLSLVLLDELGSGTDPAEGMGIAVAVLEELCKRGCLFLVTTHYPEVKEFAEKTEGMINARMAFDRETLKPLYRLELGEAGESCALYIAKRLGMPLHLLARARAEAERAGQGPDASLPPSEDFPDTEPAPPAVKKAPIKLEAAKLPKQVSAHAASFHVGDSVVVYPGKETGLIFHTANDRGELGVQVRGKKKWIVHKRVKLQVAACELYPEDYDFSIVFDSVENRKARHNMDRKHQPGLTVQCDEFENPPAH